MSMMAIDRIFVRMFNTVTHSLTHSHILLTWFMTCIDRMMKLYFFPLFFLLLLLLIFFLLLHLLFLADDLGLYFVSKKARTSHQNWSMDSLIYGFSVTSIGSGNAHVNIRWSSWCFINSTCI